jgi:hypothetical protein
MKYYFFITVTLLTCCSNDKSTKQTDIPVVKNMFDKEYLITPKKIFINEIFHPETMLILDDYLFLSCSKCDTVIFQFSLPDFMFIRKYGVMGPGPDEFQIPILISNGSDKLTVWGFSELKKIRQYFIDNGNNISLSNPDKEFSMSKIQLRNHMHLLKDSFLVYSAIPEKFLLRKINLYDQTQIIEHELKINTNVKEPFFQDDMGLLAASDQGIAYLYKYKNKIDFFDLNLNIVNSTNPDAKKISIDTNPSESSVKRNITYYSGYYSGKNYLYASYRGYSLADSKLPGHYHIIEQYDWKGNKIAKYILNTSLYSYAINEKTNKLYGYNSNDGNYFYEYDLSVSN